MVLIYHRTILQVFNINLCFCFIIMSQDHYSGFIPFWCLAQTVISIPFVTLLSFYTFVDKVMYHPSFFPIRTKKVEQISILSDKECRNNW